MPKPYTLCIRSRTALQRERFDSRLNEYCPLCCAPASARGVDIAVCLNGTAEIVCRSCALEHDPALGFVFFEYTQLIL